jgi:Fe2+ or Zn2+ uptake regulation protein
MVKKGLSLEQKRERVLEFFHETDSVFQFKEVEKEAVKRGVTAQSVKDVVQSLIDDNLVNQVCDVCALLMAEAVRLFGYCCAAYVRKVSIRPPSA